MFTVEAMLKQLEGLPLSIPIEVDIGKKTVDISYIKVNTFQGIPYQVVIMPETTETEIESTQNTVIFFLALFTPAKKHLLLLASAFL